MRKKYGIFIIFFIILLSGSLVTLLNYFYSFDYLYNRLIRRDFAVNPRIEMKADKEYTIRIWYYPFYRNINERDEKEFLKLLKEEVSAIYPNVKIITGQLNFESGHKELMAAIREGNPPDIYFNLTNLDLIEENMQLPVSPYISEVEKKFYYSVNWNKVSHRDKLWGWPILVERQSWLINGVVNIDTSGNQFLEQLSKLKKNSLYLNYKDEILLKQFLTLIGLDTFKVSSDGKLDLDTYRALEDIFYFLDYLRTLEVLYNNSSEMPELYIKNFLEGEAQVIGAINPYLNYFISKKMGSDVQKFHLNRIKKNYYLNIFRQRKYKGDDHSRAVMEVARIFSQNLSRDLAEELSMQPAYMTELSGDLSGGLKTVIEIRPEVRNYWQETLLPLWLKFWEEDLSPEEVMGKLKW